MTSRWYLLQIERGREEAVSGFINMLEFESETSRFGSYILARFDSDTDPWGYLTHAKAKRAGIVRVMVSRKANGELSPIPVLDPC